jgi:phosphoribosyl-ATP pyrophosphohydrolase
VKGHDHATDLDEDRTFVLKHGEEACEVTCKVYDAKEEELEEEYNDYW